MMEIAGADDVANFAGLNELILEEATDSTEGLLSDDTAGESVPGFFSGSHLVPGMRFCI